MTLLQPIRKYLSLDQVVVFTEVYAAVINDRHRFAEAVKVLEREDPKRNFAAVKKIVDSLNRKFEDQFGQPLLIKKDSDRWEATEVGALVYRFAVDVRRRLDALEDELQHFVRADHRINFAIRDTQLINARKILERHKAARIAVDIQTEIAKSATLGAIFETVDANVVLDELFYSDKQRIDKSLYKFIQMPSVPIFLAFSEGFPLSDVGVIGDGDAATLELSQLRDLPIKAMRKALPIRAAAELAAIDLAGDDLLSSQNLAAVRGAYQNLEFIEADVNQVAFSVSPSENYALLVTNEDLAAVDAVLGMKHIKVTITNKGVFQYYNPSIIMKNSIASHDESSEVGRLIQLFYEFQTTDNKKNVKFSPASVDYSKESFPCARCGHRIEYEEFEDDGGEIIKPCLNCLAVSVFRPGEGGEVDSLKTSKNIIYTDEIYDEYFVCPSEGCSSEFEPDIKKTLKGRDFVFCDSCHTVFQSQSGHQTNERVDCPACGRTHTFRVSDAKPIDEISCYNSMQKVSYNKATGETKIEGPFEPIRYETADIASQMEFLCPKFGCKDSRPRRLVRNRDGQYFTRCRTCGSDIHVVKKDS